MAVEQRLGFRELARQLNDFKSAAVTESELIVSDSDRSDEEVCDDDGRNNKIVASPYTDRAHRLDLDNLAFEVADLARALTVMTAVRDDYATAPYQLAFNWDAVVSRYLHLTADTQQLEPQRFFVIVFRSRVKVGADREKLGILDKAAHLEAIKAGGLLKYWFGTPDANRRNLATCLWRARSDARLGGAGPSHAAAMTAARQMYDEWFVERLELNIDPQTASWRFNQWPDSD